MSNEEKDLVDLFFPPQHNETPENPDIPEEIDGGIQSEAERLFRNDDEEDTMPP